MTETCERCQARLGELLQWEIEHPATAALASAAAPAPAPPAATLALASASRDGMAPPVVARANGSSAPATSASSVAEELQEPDQAEATPEELRELWQHAQECAECRSALSLLRGARQVLVELPELAPPPDLRARIRSQLASASGVAATEATTIQTKTAESASSKALSDVRQPEHGKPVSRWAFWSAANASASGAAAPATRGGGMPRAVWAGGGALVAAFCVLMALQLKPPPGPMGASAPQADSAPVLDGAQSSDAAQSSAPSPSNSANGTVKAVPTLGAPSKAPAKAPGKAPSGIDGPPAALPDPNAAPPASLPNPNRSAQSKPQGKPETGAAPSTDLPPSMPEPKIGPLPGALPDPSTSKPVPKSQAAPNLRTASPKERSEPSPKAQTAPSDSNRNARASATRPPAAAPATAPDRAREEAATIRVQVAPLPSRGDSNAAGSGSAAPIQEPQNDSSAAGSIAQSPSSTASAGGMGGGAASAPRRRSNKVRGGSDSEEPAAESGPSGPQSASPADSVPPASASPVPAPPVPAPGGAGTFSAAPGTSADSRESLSTSGVGVGSARRSASPEAASKAEATVRRVAVEVKATRAIRRAQVEVVLSEGWLFAAGSKRVMWSGRASAGQVIRFEVALKAARPGVPTRAARVRLVDAARARSASAVLSSADILIPSAADSGPKN